jgi:hypothetical protein
MITLTITIITKRAVTTRATLPALTASISQTVALKSSPTRLMITPATSLTSNTLEKPNTLNIRLPQHTRLPLTPLQPTQSNTKLLRLTVSPHLLTPLLLHTQNQLTQYPLTNPSTLHQHPPTRSHIQLPFTINPSTPLQHPHTRWNTHLLTPHQHHTRRNIRLELTRTINTNLIP